MRNPYFKNRSEEKAEKNLGIIQLNDHRDKTNNPIRPYRSERLESIMKYVEGRAYDHLMDWSKAEEISKNPEQYVATNRRKPFIQLNIPKMMASRLSSKLCGKAVFPDIKLDFDPDTEDYLKAICRAGLLKAKLVEVGRHMVTVGTGFVRYWISGGRFQVVCYNGNYCYPTFTPENELESVLIQYVYADQEDLDNSGNPIKKWYRAEITQLADILYDSPEYDPKSKEEPEFEELSRIDHGLGFVQGEWFKTGDSATSVDGVSLVDEAIPFLDSMNYSLCRGQRAADYNSDPQLAFKGMDEEEINALVRSSEKAWNMGRDGEGSFLESSMTGVQVGIEMRDKLRLFIQDMTRIVMMDPDKISGHVQSGKALEILHGPMVELINEIRPYFEMSYQSLIIKMAMSNLMHFQALGSAPVMIPEGYQPISFDMTMIWPPIFPMTTSDLVERVRWVSSAVNANLVSRRTGIKILAADFGVEDVDMEYEEILAQPVLNPFMMM